MMKLASEMGTLKLVIEGMRKPLTIEMNNLRKENENMQREIERLMR